MTNLQADYIIVGGGSAGSVLANRLSADGTARVLLLEAGGEAKSLLVQMPAGFARLLLNRKMDWLYQQRADASINGRRFIWSAGKLLGGSSSINGQVYIRGLRGDFARWAEHGAAGWDWDGVLPYFLRSETWHGTPSQNHGRTGPLAVSEMIDPHPLCAVFLAACREFGLPTLDDYNGGEMEGAFLTQATQLNGWRCSTEKAYLRPARGRANLQIITHAEATAINFDGKRAAGVAFTHGGKDVTASAAREVIVCAGAMGSPALLMRSGVGAGAALRAHGIAVVHENPAVGENLQEHPGIGQNKFVAVPTLNSQLGAWDMARHALKFLRNRGGPLGAPAVQAMALARSRDGLDEPDVQLHFMPLAYDIEPDTVSAAQAVMPKEPCISINLSLTRTYSRGRVVLGDRRQPVISHELLGDPRDLATMISGLKMVSRLFSTAALRAIVTRDRVPARPPANDRDWEDFARAKTAITYHAVGTCRMGAGSGDVVDTACRVFGVAGLRVADASVMPFQPSANTNAAAIMIGEKIAEAILKEA